jgi:predicted XRE-type DNA-binding protein
MSQQHWRTWDEIKAEAIAAGRLDEDKLAEGVARLRAIQRAYRLAELRQQQGWTQTEMAERMHVSQPRVSAVERGEVGSTETGTLAAYVAALGGHLELVADFGDQRLVIG